MEQNNNRIPREKFRFVHLDERLHDKKFETKPIGYFKDAMIRFSKNKASVVAAIIIALIVIFAVVTPFVAEYEIYDADGVYSKIRPKSQLFVDLGWGFWDGAVEQTMNDKYLIYYAGVGMAYEDGDGQGSTWDEGWKSDVNPIITVKESYIKEEVTYRVCDVDSCYQIGFRYLSLTKDEFQKILDWEAETGIQVVYPMVDTTSKYCDVNNADDANFWYRHASNGSPLNNKGKRMDLAEVRENGLLDNYLRDAEGNVLYSQQKDKNMLVARVWYYNFYQYKNGHEPTHLFGTDKQGYDILIRLASGIQLSLILAISVFAVNFIVGAIYGSIEGYYGGWVDIVMERLSDILSSMPTIIIMTLVQLHLVLPGKMSTLGGIIFAFCLTGWLGTAYSVRTQFYRFKNQEYILAARTLGAKDTRLMFKHIFPNAIGTIITGSVLGIPATIGSEATLSFLGIINFNSKNITSLGTMLSNGQDYLRTDPHILFFPAVIISLLMISFNLFGNGLRDAFNPSLRGVDD